MSFRPVKSHVLSQLHYMQRCKTFGFLIQMMRFHPGEELNQQRRVKLFSHYLATNIDTGLASLLAIKPIMLLIKYMDTWIYFLRYHSLYLFISVSFRLQPLRASRFHLTICTRPSSVIPKPKISVMPQFLISFFFSLAF